MVAVDEKYHSERIILPDSEQLEYVCVRVSIGSCRLFVFAVYIRSVLEIEKFLLFAEIARKIPCNEDDAVIVCGDFNQSGIIWVKADDGDYFLPTNVTTESEIAVCETMLDCGMHQMCNLTDPAGNVLDLVFTNKFYEISLFESTRPLIKLDMWHKAIEIEVTFDDDEPPKTCKTKQTYAYHLANYDAIDEFISSNESLLNIGNFNNVDVAIGILYGFLHETIEKFVPEKNCPNKHRSTN